MCNIKRNLVGFSPQKQFQIPQAVLWNSTVFLKGEAHKIGKRISLRSTKDVPVHASTPRRTSGSFLIQQRGPAKPVHVQIVQIGIRRCIICTPRTVDSAVHHRRCIICTPRTVNSAVHHNTTDCQLGGASYVHHRWTPRTVNSAVHHMHTTEKILKGNVRLGLFKRTILLTWPGGAIRENHPMAHPPSPQPQQAREMTRTPHITHRTPTRPATQRRDPQGNKVYTQRWS